ncbi:hypothetical protein ACQP3J_28355, partial [Escherichia coli]
VEQKLDDRLCFVFYMIWAERSTTYVEMQHIYNNINTKRSSISETLDSKQAADRGEVKDI